MHADQGEGPRPGPKFTAQKDNLTTEAAAARKVAEVTSFLRQMGLFGDYTPKGENPT